MKAAEGPYTLSSPSFSFFHPWLPIFMAGDGVAAGAKSRSAWDTARSVLLHYGSALSLSSGVGLARLTSTTLLRPKTMQARDQRCHHNAVCEPAGSTVPMGVSKGGMSGAKAAVEVLCAGVHLRRRHGHAGSYR